MLIECIATKHFDSLQKKMSSEGKNADGAASVNYPSTWDRFANLDRYSFRSQQISGHHPFFKNRVAVAAVVLDRWVCGVDCRIVHCGGEPGRIANNLVAV